MTSKVFLMSASCEPEQIIKNGPQIKRTGFNIFQQIHKDAPYDCSEQNSPFPSPALRTCRAWATIPESHRDTWRAPIAGGSLDICHSRCCVGDCSRLLWNSDAELLRIKDPIPAISAIAPLPIGRLKVSRSLKNAHQYLRIFIICIGNSILPDLWSFHFHILSLRWGFWPIQTLSWCSSITSHCV